MSHVTIDRPFHDSLAAVIEYEEAILEGDDRWVAACGGCEEPTWSSDRRAWFLRVYNPARDEHGWLNLSTDMVEVESPFRKEE